MAFTGTIVKKESIGSTRMHLVAVTADAVSGAVDTGLSYVDAFSIGIISCATAGFQTRVNLSAASAALNGSVMVDNVASGDAFYIVAYGRG